MGLREPRYRPAARPRLRPRARPRGRGSPARLSGALERHGRVAPEAYGAVRGLRLLRSVAAEGMTLGEIPGYLRARGIKAWMSDRKNPGTAIQALRSGVKKPRRPLAHRRSSWTAIALQILRMLTKYGPKLVRLALVVHDAWRGL
jgi:hypothetical protein